MLERRLKFAAQAVVLGLVERQVSLLQRRLLRPGELALHQLGCAGRLAQVLVHLKILEDEVEPDRSFRRVRAGLEPHRLHVRRSVQILEDLVRILSAQDTDRDRLGAAALEREAEDICAVVRHAGERVTLLGHSYGGLCSIEAALELPELHRLILYEPPLPLGSLILSPAVREELNRLVKGGDREGALLYFFREVVGVPEADLDSLKAHPVWPARIAAAHTIIRESDEEESYGVELSRLRALRVPTLLLLGGESPAAFAEATARFNVAIPNSHVRELVGQRHIAMDTAPEDSAMRLGAPAGAASSRRVYFGGAVRGCSGAWRGRRPRSAAGDRPAARRA